MINKMTFLVESFWKLLPLKTQLKFLSQRIVERVYTVIKIDRNSQNNKTYLCKQDYQ